MLFAPEPVLGSLVRGLHPLSAFLFRSRTSETAGLRSREQRTDPLTEHYGNTTEQRTPLFRQRVTRRSALGVTAAVLGGGIVAASAAPAAAFTLGSTKPTRSNVGPRTTSLRKHKGRIYVDKPGQVIEGLDIEGDIVIRAPRVTVRNCKVRGMRGINSSRGLIDCTHRSVRDARIEFCELFVDARWPSAYYAGVQGHHMRVYRCYIHEVVDGVGIMNPHERKSTSCLIEGNLIENLTYFTPVSHQSDRRTHNDCIQHQGGSWDVIRGNYLSANPSPAVGVGLKANASPRPNEFASSNSVPGQCIGITPVLSTVTNCQIRDNWMKHGAQSVNVIRGHHHGTNVGRIEGNRFLGGNPSTFLAGSKQPRSIVITPDMSVTGIRTSTGPDHISRNVNGAGKPVTIWRIKLS